MSFPVLISPSLLSADFLNLQSEIEMLNRSVADWIHLDIMDGHFVPNITFGMPVIAQVKKIAQKPLDVHLMIEKPERYISDFCKAGAYILTVHIEGSTHLHRTIKLIKDCGAKAGVAINPHTNVSSLSDILEDIDVVLIMSVNPGFGGQKFIEHSYSKIIRLKEMIKKYNCKTMIEVDGGVDNTNAEALINAGADILVSGNYIFGSQNPETNICTLKQTDLK